MLQEAVKYRGGDLLGARVWQQIVEEMSLLETSEALKNVQTCKDRDGG
jgi:hypothetical protein